MMSKQSPESEEDSFAATPEVHQAEENKDSDPADPEVEAVEDLGGAAAVAAAVVDSEILRFWNPLFSEGK